MTHRHAIVWLDHYRATVTDFSVDHANTVSINSAAETPQLHIKSGRPGSGHVAHDVKFFAEIVAALGNANEILIVGPGVAKIAFSRFVEQHDRRVAERVVGVEPMDHPTDRELLAFGRKYFHRTDQLLGDGTMR
jgi:stalled ribosome rescue protein Dom34